MEPGSIEKEIAAKEARKVDVAARIEDLEDMIATYEKQPTTSMMDIIIIKLKRELADLKREEAELGK